MAAVPYWLTLCVAAAAAVAQVLPGADWQGVVKTWDVATWKNVTNLNYAGE